MDEDDSESESNDELLSNNWKKNWPQNCRASIGKVLVKWFYDIPKEKRVVDGVDRVWKLEKPVERHSLKLKKVDAHTISENVQLKSYRSIRE